MDAPRITVSTPGRGEVSGELLTAGPAAAPVPRGPRLLGLAAAAVLVAGGLAAYDLETAPPPPVVLPRTVAVAGVSATVERLPPDRELVERLRLTVLEQAATGRGDSGGSPDPGGLVLLEVLARGFGVQVSGAPLPLVLSEGERRSSGGVERTPLPVEVVVVDCAVDPGAPRQVQLRVRRGDGPVGTVLAASSPDVVRGLDRLVSRTCRRPRG